MPELPDVELYVASLRRFFCGKQLVGVRLASPFLLRSVEVPVSAAAGRKLVDFRRMGKRVVWQFEGELFYVFHLMISGRFHMKKAGASLPRKTGLAAFDFESCTLFLTEMASKKRASLHVVSGEDALRAFDPGGLEIMNASEADFAAALTNRNHTLKRALTHPRIFSGIGNAFSDEILHEARLSPMKRSQSLDKNEMQRLFQATRKVLTSWTEQLAQENGERFPEKVTAFREGMAVHGRYGKPCPRCGTPVQRIVYGDREVNYCAPCQTGGKLLSDRALSRLLREDWPKTVEEWEQLTGRSQA